MTVVKQKLVEMLPEMPSMIQDLSDESAEQILNIFVTLKKEPEKKDVSYRIGAGKGEFNIPDDFDSNNEEIYAQMAGYALS